MRLANACPFCSCLEIRAINDSSRGYGWCSVVTMPTGLYVGTAKMDKAGDKNAAVLSRDGHPSRPPGRVED